MTVPAPDQRGRPVTKSAAAFRTISEVSAELDVPQHVLRFWETKFPQIRPLKRGGGRRYYRPEDVDLLRHIQSLLHREGYTIRGVQRLLREMRGGPAETAPLAPPQDESSAVPGRAPAAVRPRPEEEEAPVAEPPAAEAIPDTSTASNAVPEDRQERQRGELRIVLAELMALRDLLRDRGQG